MAAMAFQYLEIRPCIHLDGGYQSFAQEIDFDIECDRLKAAGARLETVWSLYGVYPLDVGTDAVAPLETALIGDFDSKASALVILNALLAPMAKARDHLVEADREYDIDAGDERHRYAGNAEEASLLLTDFINQSSNHERL